MYPEDRDKQQAGWAVLALFIAFFFTIFGMIVIVHFVTKYW